MQFHIADTFTHALARLLAHGSKGGENERVRSAGESGCTGPAIPSHRQPTIPTFDGSSHDSYEALAFVVKFDYTMLA